MQMNVPVVANDGTWSDTPPPPALQRFPVLRGTSTDQPTPFNLRGPEPFFPETIGAFAVRGP